MDNYTNPENNTQNTTQATGGTYSYDYVNNNTNAQSTDNVYAQNTAYTQQNASVDNTYAQSSTYTQSNTYAQPNTYANNGYTQPNTYTGATAAWQQQHQQQQYNNPYNNQGVYNAGMYNAMPTKKNEKIAFSIISLILGILSILCCCWIAPFNLILAIPGLILGIIPLKKGYAGKGMAIAGTICSAVGLLLSVVYIILLVIGFASLDSAGYSYSDIQDLYDYSYNYYY